MAEKSFKRMYKRRKRKKLRRLALLTGVLGLSGLGLYAWVTSGDCGCQVEEAAQPVQQAAGACTDEVTGTWVGQQRLNGYTYRFTIDVERAAPGSDQLQGTITSDYWLDLHATTDITNPPDCGSSSERMVITMPASGAIQGDEVTFKGESWKLNKEVCGSFDGGYFPDGFTGSLNANEGLTVTNNDGYNNPTEVHFERIRCQGGATTASAL